MERENSPTVNWLKENHFNYHPFGSTFAEIESDLYKNMVMPRDRNSNALLDLVKLNENFLIYGKAGSGKTALALMLQREYRMESGEVNPLPIYLRFEGGTDIPENVEEFIDRQIAEAVGHEILFQIVYKSWKKKHWSEEQKNQLVNLMVSANSGIPRLVSRLKEEENLEVLDKKVSVNFLTDFVPGREIKGALPDGGIRKTLEAYNFPRQSQIGEFKQKSAMEISQELLSKFNKDWSGICLIVEIGNKQQKAMEIISYISKFDLKVQKTQLKFIVDDLTTVVEDVELQNFYKAHIDWEDSHLLEEVIERRLLSASNDDVLSLHQLAEPSIRGWIETHITNVVIASGRATPREVLILASKVLDHAIKSGNHRITRIVVDSAVKEYKQEIAAKIR